MQHQAPTQIASGQRPPRIGSTTALLIASLLFPALPWVSLTVAHAGSVEGHLQTFTIASKIFDEDRKIVVWVPPSYSASGDQRFPLLLSLQGENLFDAESAAGGDEWALDELLSRSPTGIPEFLVVGIVSASSAIRDYATPGSQVDAQAQQLMQHVMLEVLPFVEKTWRLEEEYASRYLMGMGISALTAVYGAWLHADAFAGALAFDLPDVDPKGDPWQLQEPIGGRPWFWLEQRSSDRSRQSNSALFAALQRHGDVTMMVAGPQASRPARLAAALRATPLARWQRQQVSSPDVSSP